MRFSTAVIAFFVILLIITVPLFSDESTAVSSYVIDSIEYRIDGNTKESALRALSDLEGGMAFPGFESMTTALEAEKQDLINRRVFESVAYETILVGTADGVSRYNVIFNIDDAFTLVAIPYPNYDSNTGLRLGLKTYWDNFLGTMTNAYLGLGMNFQYNDESDRVEIGEWNIDTSISGIRVSEVISLSAGISQSRENESFDDPVVPSNSYDYWYYSTSARAGTSFDLKKNRSYGVSMGVDFRYLYEGELGSQFEQPYAITLGHGFYQGKVDWIENFRNGYSFGVSNPYRFGSNGDLFLITSLNASASYFVPFWKRFNFMTRGQAFYQWGELRSIGSSLRGVRDDTMSGYTGAILNTSLAFQFWRFEKVFDAQIHPFLDIGVVYNNESFDVDRDVNYGIGADFVLYIDKLPSLVAVGSIGIDPKTFDSNDIFGSLEISISSSLIF